MSAPGADAAEGALVALRSVAEAGEAPVDIARVALAIAALDRPSVPLDRYEEHLATLGETAAQLLQTESGGGDDVDGGEILREALWEAHGYRGDDRNYDDLQNANLMRVIDRKRGLPVALGILWIHTARAVGWTASGLAFPGHFLIRVDQGATRRVLDPFHGGEERDTVELRALLRRMTTADAELKPEHWAEVSDRQILLRLQNNIKLRLVQQGQAERAFDVLERMVAMAPADPGLVREAAMVEAHLGRLREAIRRLERFIEAGSGPETARHALAQVLQSLRRQLN